MSPEQQLLLAVVSIAGTTVGSVLFVARWLDGKISDLDTKHTQKIDSLESTVTASNQRLEDKLGGGIKEVRQASADAHKEILNQLCDIKVEQGRHSERFKSIDQRLEMTRPDDDH